MIDQETDDAIAAEVRQALESLMRQMKEIDHWHHALSLTLLVSCRMLQTARGDEYMRELFERGLDDLSKKRPLLH
jgi:hypothetical protein